MSILGSEDALVYDAHVPQLVHNCSLCCKKWLMLLIVFEYCVKHELHTLSVSIRNNKHIPAFEL